MDTPSPLFIRLFMVLWNSNVLKITSLYHVGEKYPHLFIDLLRIKAVNHIGVDGPGEHVRKLVT